MFLLLAAFMGYGSLVCAAALDNNAIVKMGIADHGADGMQAAVITRPVEPQENETPLAFDAVHELEEKIEDKLDHKTRISLSIYIDDQPEETKKDPKAFARFQRKFVEQGKLKILALIEDGTLTPGDFKGIRASTKMDDADYGDEVGINVFAPLEEIREFIKAQMPKAEREKRREKIEKEIVRVQAETGIRIDIQPFANSYEKAEDFIRFMGQLLTRPDVLEKSILAVSLTNKTQSFAAKFDPRGQMFTIAPEWSHEEIEKKIMEIPRASTQEEIEAQKKSLQMAIQLVTLPQLKTELEELTKKMDAIAPIFEERKSLKQAYSFIRDTGVTLNMTDPDLQKPEARDALYARMKTILKQAAPDRAVRNITFDKKEGPDAITLSGSLEFKTDATDAEILAAINATPDKATFQKKTEEIRGRLQALSKKFGEGVAIQTDFDHNNTVQDIESGYQTLEQLYENGFRLKPPVRTIYITGKHVQGWAGARNWDAKAIVMRSDAAPADVLGFLENPAGQAIARTEGMMAPKKQETPQEGMPMQPANPFPNIGDMGKTPKI